MNQYIYLNSKIILQKDAKISVENKGLLYGFGLFETIRAYNYIPFRLCDHIDRMLSSAKIFKIPFSISYNKLEKDISKLLYLNKLSSAYIRITITSGSNNSKPNLIIVTKKLPPLPKNYYLQGVKIVFAPWRRNIFSPIISHKTLNYLENILAREEAKREDAFEAVFVDYKNNLLEGTVSNIFIVKNGIVITPNLKSNILPGITRKVILDLCRLNKIKAIERQVKIRELDKADEMLITNSLIEVMPVSYIGSKKIGSGKRGRLTQKVHQLYKATAAKECNF